MAGWLASGFSSLVVSRSFTPLVRHHHVINHQHPIKILHFPFPAIFSLTASLFVVVTSIFSRRRVLSWHFVDFVGLADSHAERT